MFFIFIVYFIIHFYFTYTISSPFFFFFAMIFNLVFKICFSQFSWIVIPNQYKWSSLSKIKNKWSSSKLGPYWVHNKLYENVFSRPKPSHWMIPTSCNMLSPTKEYVTSLFSLSLSLSQRRGGISYEREKIYIRCMLYFLLKGIGRDLTVQSPPYVCNMTLLYYLLINCTKYPIRFFKKKKKKIQLRSSLHVVFVDQISSLTVISLIALTR